MPAGSRLIWLDSPVDSSSRDVGGYLLAEESQHFAGFHLVTPEHVCG